MKEDKPKRRCSVCGTVLSSRNKCKNKCFLHKKTYVTTRMIAALFREKKLKEDENGKADNEGGTKRGRKRRKGKKR